MRIIIIPIRELIIPIIPIRFHKLYPVIFLRLLKFLKLADSFFHHREHGGHRAFFIMQKRFYFLTYNYHVIFHIIWLRAAIYG